jgi:hypothetical protein
MIFFYSHCHFRSGICRLVNLRNNAVAIVSCLLDEFRFKNLDVSIVRVR